MLNKLNLTKMLMGLLMLVLLVAPQLSYAQGYNRGDHRFYRWHDHPHYGWHMHYLPHGYFTIWVGRARYYYYDGLYYTYVGGNYVLVTPPIGAFVSVIPSDFQPVIINGRTYYTDNGVYYVLTRHHGYKVVVAPVVYTQPAQVVVVQNTFPVNIPNNAGGYITVTIRKTGNGFMGPQGEFYPQFPTVSQLKVMYVR